MYLPFSDRLICIVCQSGNRAKAIKDKLANASFDNIALLETQMEHLQHFALKNTGWTIDRQFRFLLGLLLAIFLISYFMGYTGFIAIPVILCVGLIFTALINKCYLRMGVAMLPWNRGKQE